MRTLLESLENQSRQSLENFKIINIFIFLKWNLGADLSDMHFISKIQYKDILCLLIVIDIFNRYE